jgi:hypothetical protein
MTEYSVSKPKKARKMAIPCTNPLYLYEVVEKICKYLPTEDLHKCKTVSVTWYQACGRELFARRPAFPSFR